MAAKKKAASGPKKNSLVNNINAKKKGGYIQAKK